MTGETDYGNPLVSPVPGCDMPVDVWSSTDIFRITAIDLVKFIGITLLIFVTIVALIVYSPLEFLLGSPFRYHYQKEF